jgi:hypothetical protein
MIAPCIVAICDLFRGLKWRQNGEPGLKWPIPEKGVPVFTEMLPYGPEKQAIGGDFGLRLAQPSREPGGGVVGDFQGE